MGEDTTGHEDGRETAEEPGGEEPYGGDLRLLTVAEVADLLRVSNMTVYRLIRRGDLPALRVGKNYRIRRRDIEAYLEAGSVEHGSG